MTQCEREAHAFKLIGKLKRLASVPLNIKTGVSYRRLQFLVTKERLRRGEITVHDLTPVARRALVDLERLDLHALAAGPIMQPDALYLPAGRITLAEAKVRETGA